ncbi:MarR family transcriptional regulator [Bacteroidetes bacterium UKL13-3]|jgi:DNA-binding MarR family transcriptional regulator|nr:MarR family transcriptional regulator [Bacteroidetes bacterium UKL13-3]HCP94750.1 MarR family transcriptional regulator [Bacteroidota bacterium]
MAKKETTCSRIKQSWHAISRMYNNEAVNHELTTTTGFILLNIDSHEGTPSTQIGPLLGMEATSLSRTMKQLEERGIIKRKKDKQDARVVRMLLTEKGKKKKEISKKTVKDFNKIIVDKYSPAQLELFHEMLDDITAIAIETKFNNK